MLHWSRSFLSGRPLRMVLRARCGTSGLGAVCPPDSLASSGNPTGGGSLTSGGGLTMQAGPQPSLRISTTGPALETLQTAVVPGRSVQDGGGQTSGWSAPGTRGTTLESVGQCIPSRPATQQYTNPWAPAHRCRWMRPAMVHAVQLPAPAAVAPPPGPGPGPGCYHSEPRGRPRLSLAGWLADLHSQLALGPVQASGSPLVEEDLWPQWRGLPHPPTHPPTSWGP